MSFKSKTLLARELRKNMTPSERKLWSFLRYKRILNYGFRRQYPIAGFIVDFYCPKLKLIIEVDGAIHNTKQNQKNDKNREEILSKFGAMIIRIKNEEIDNNIEETIYNLTNYIKSISPPHR